MTDQTQNEIDIINEVIKGDIEITRMEQATPWRRALNAARRTIGRKPLDKEPSDSWKAKIILAEHSPVRLVEFDWSWKNIRQWVTAHMVRHHEGCEKFVHSQRGDRRDLPIERDKLPQGAVNDMDMTANVQALVSIGRKRCCMCASKETRVAWDKVIKSLEKIDPVLAGKIVPECVYRGFCPEWMSTCKYCYTPAWWQAVARYRNTVYGDDETWVVDTDELYEISNIGRVRDAVTHEIHKEYIHENRPTVKLDGKLRFVYDLMCKNYPEIIGKVRIDKNEFNNNINNFK